MDSPDEITLPFKSGSWAIIWKVGPGHGRFWGFFVTHRFVRSLAVLTAAFRVMQNIIIGFFWECFEMISGSLICFSIDLIEFLPILLTLDHRLFQIRNHYHYKAIHRHVFEV